MRTLQPFVGSSLNINKCHFHVTFFRRRSFRLFFYPSSVTYLFCIFTVEIFAKSGWNPPHNKSFADFLLNHVLQAFRSLARRNLSAVDFLHTHLQIFAFVMTSAYY